MKRNRVNSFVKRCFLLLSLLFVVDASADDYFSAYKTENYVNRIAVKDNCLWIATSKGLVKYNKTSNIASSASDELGVNSNIKYLSIATAPDNSLWFASEEEGIVKYNETLTEYWSSIWGDNMFAGYIYAFAFNSEGNIFSGEFDEIIYVDNLVPIDSYFACKQRYRFVDIYMSHEGAYTVTDMTFDSKGDMWIATKSDVLYPSDLSYKAGYLIKKDKNGLEEALKTTYLWPNTPLGAENILYSDEIEATSIKIDSDDNIWLLAEDGIHYYNQLTQKDSIITHTTHPQIPNERFLANDIDDNGNIWFSSSTTLMKYDGEEFTTYTCSGYEGACSILCDGNTVWILLKNDKLLRYQNKRFKVIDLSPVINTGINESIADTPKTKAFVSNGVLYIESEEDITSINIYDSMGRNILTPNPSPVERGVEITLPNIKGVLLVKVNNEILKVIK